MGEEQITALPPTSSLSIKDEIAHLRAWQQISIARLEAAQLNREPVFPDWIAGLDPESGEERDQFNARIYEAHHQEPWSRVGQDWKDGYLRFLELGEAIPEKDLMDKDKDPWLKGYSLFAVLQHSYEHHEEHLEQLLVRLHHQGKK